jgi:hypothetical protein
MSVLVDRRHEADSELRVTVAALKSAGALDSEDLVLRAAEARAYRQGYREGHDLHLPTSA